MKILQINSVCGYGSTGRIATDLYKIYEEHGHECVIAYGRGEASSEFKTIKIGNKISNYMHVLNTRIFDNHGFSSKRGTEDFIKEVKTYNPDIIHLHNIHGYYINVEILFDYIKKEKKKVIWTLHDCWSFTGHCVHFEYEKCEKWKSGCEKCGLIKEYPKAILKDNSKQNHKRKKEVFLNIEDMTIITPSKWLKNLVDKSFLKGYETKVINNGIDLEKFKFKKSDIKKKYGLQDKKVILGVASVWTEKKGLKYFQELSKEIDETYKIVLIGLDEKQKNELSSNIVGIERTNSIEELAEFYSIADVFFNPTLEDNFPTTNIEALTCGAPVVTFRTGGSIEVIEEGNGAIVEKAEDSFKIIKEVIEYKDRERCIETSRKYDKYKKFKEYIELINEM